jgi:hypothetical protein
MVREPNATMRPAPQDNQLMSKHRLLGFKPQLRLEWRSQDGQNEAEQPDHPASLGDSIASSTRMRFSVHTLPLIVSGMLRWSSADPVRRSAMIRFQKQNTKLPTRSAVGRRGRINAAAFAASVIGLILSACSGQSVPATSAAAQYPDLNDAPPRVSWRADQAAQIKAELIQVRDETQEHAARPVAQTTGPQPVLASK